MNFTLNNLLKRDNVAGRKAKDELPLKGCMTKFSDEEVRKMGEEELKRLPVLVKLPTGEGLIKFSALLPKEDGHAYPVIKGANNQSARVVEVSEEDFEKGTFEKSKMLCSVDGGNAFVSKAEQLPIGFVASTSDSEDDCNSDSESDNQWKRGVSKLMFSDSESDCGESEPKTSRAIGEGLFQTEAWENAISWGEEGESDSEVPSSYRQHEDEDVVMDGYDNGFGEIGPSSGAEGSNGTSLEHLSKKDSTVHAIAPTMAQDNLLVDDDDDDDFIDLQVKWTGDGATSSTTMVATPKGPTTAFESELQGSAYANPWSQREKKYASEIVTEKDVVLHEKLVTPINQDLFDSKWISLIVWDGDDQFVRGKLLFDQSAGIPLIVDRNDTNYLMREEVEMAYGDDSRPGSKRTTVAKLISTEKEVVDTENMGRKQRKKFTKEGRKRKLRASGYFRFIDALNDRNNDQGKGVRDRLRIKRLPDIPKEIPVRISRMRCSEDDALHFHHPTLRFPRDFLITTPQVSSQEGGIRQIRSKWNEDDLSAANGPVCLFEYMEQRPPLICEVGMSSILVNFYKADKPTNENFVPPIFPGGGRTMVLEPDDRSPFFAILEDKQRCAALCNDLWVAPAFEHNVHPTDFLLVRQRIISDVKGEHGTCFIRNVRSLHLVGQTEPQREVVSPASTLKKPDLNHYLEQQVTQYLLEACRRNIDTVVGQEEMKSRFQSWVNLINKLSGQPKSKDKSPLNKVLSKVAQTTKSGGFVLKEDVAFHDLQSSNICQYQSLQAGLARLESLGISETPKFEVTRVMHAHAILLDLYQLSARASKAFEWAQKSGGTAGVISDSTEEKEWSKTRVPLSKKGETDLKTAQFIVDELQLSPWYLTKSYLTMRKEEKPKLKLTGLGDPSGRMEAISYLPESIDGLAKKSVRRRRKNETIGSAATSAAVEAIRKSNDLENSNENEEGRKKKGGDRYGGTDKDLRGLTLQDGEKILSNLGHNADEIELLDRWDRIMLIEEYASAAGGVENVPILSKFARNAKKMSEKEIKERDEVQKKVNKLFQVQLSRLSSDVPPEYVEETKEKIDQRKKERKEKRKKQKIKEKKRKQREKKLAKNRKGDGEDEESGESQSDEDEDADSDAEDSEVSEVDLPDESGDSSSSSDDDDDDSDSSQAGDQSFFANFREQMGESSSSTIGDNQRTINDFIRDKEQKKAMDEAIKRARDEAAERQIPAPEGWSNKRPQILKRTVIRILSNGETEVSVEYNKNPADIQQAKRAIHDRESAGASMDRRLLGKGMGQPSSRTIKDNERRREKGLLAYKEYKANIKKYGENWPMTVQPKPGESEKRCGQCKLPGHTSAAKQCPFYFIDVKPNTDVTVSDDLKVKVHFPGKNSEKHALKMLKSKGQSGKTKRQDRNSSRRRGPVAELGGELKKIWMELNAMEEANFFRKKVDKKVYPDYYKMVSTPMYLDNILKSIEGLKYTSSEELIDHLTLMYQNSVTYNGADHPISLDAQKLLTAAKDLIDANHEEIFRLEREAKEAGHAIKPPEKKRKVTFRSSPFGTKKRAGSSGGSSAMPVPTTFVIDPFSNIAGPGSGPTSEFFSSMDPSPSPSQYYVPGSATPGPSPSPPGPSPSPPGPSPSPPPGTPFTFPSQSPSASPGAMVDADLMDLENAGVVEEVVEEEEEEELLD